MSSKDSIQSTPSDDAQDVERDDSDPGGDSAPRETTGGREIGGRKGPDPTRYGDWEKAGRCIDF
jgi:hypothetical protein